VPDAASPDSAATDSVATDSAAPILLSRDLDETLRFYSGLGFENRGAPPDEWHYLILGRGGIELHVQHDPDHDPLRTAAMCYLHVDDALALHARWAPAVVPRAATGTRIESPQVTDYGMHEFALVDPGGNLLRVGSPADDPSAA